jgi:hypothetical protein
MSPLLMTVAMAGRILGSGGRAGWTTDWSEENRVKFSRIRRNGPKVVAFVYAGYKWLEDHTDEVERWSARAVERSRGKPVEKFVTPVAGAAQSAARWMRDNNENARRKSEGPTKR